jgi:CheY-like chemotaxis protein
MEAPSEFPGKLEKNRLLAGMAQQIRTPLNAILGMIELLIDSPLSAKQQEYARLIQDSGDALLVLVNDLLDYAHLESGELELTQTAVDLRSCMDDALDLLSSYAAVKNPNIACFIEPEVPEVVRADPVRLRQVLGRLLGYSVLLAEGSEVVASVKARPQGQEQYEIQFVIRKYSSPDEAQRDAALIWNQQVTDRIQLGLEICRLLVKKMGGSLSVGHQQNREVLFSFSIQGESEAWQPARRRQRSTQPLLGGKSVLLAVHDEQQRNELAQQLLYWQLKPIPVGTAVQALQIIEFGQALDAAIIVQNLPEFDASVFSDRIRQTAAGRNLPLILVAPWRSEQVETPARFSALLAEPVKPYQLYEAISRLMAEQLRFAPSPTTATLLDSGMAQRHPLHILLAVSEASEQKVTQGFLERLGYRPDKVENSADVLRALLRKSYDMLIIDQDLLLGDVGVLAKIEQLLPPITRPSVVVLTSQRLPGDRTTSITSAIQAIILKPVHAGDLIGALEDCRPLRITQAGQGAIEGYAGVALTQLAIDNAADQHEELPPIDALFLSQFDSMTGSDVAPLLVQLADYFTSNAARLLVQMQQAIDSQEPGAIRQAAEMLRASSANIGARRMAELCAEADKTVQLLGLPGVQEQMGRILAEYNRVRDCLEKLTKKASR